MKVILLQDVAKLGRKFDVASVPDGYALNQLIPKKMAEAATPESLKRLEQRKNLETAASDKRAHKVTGAVTLLSGKSLEIRAEANEQGHLFAALRESDIVTAFSLLGANIEPSMVSIKKPIKSLGEHTIELTNHGEAVPVAVSIVSK